MGTEILKGQVAVVTGGGRGIGRAIAQTLARAGARVAVLARSPQELQETVKLIEEAGGDAQAFVADVSEATEVARAFSEINRALGAVDLLVNNAAVLRPFGPLWENDPGEWWRGMEVNVRGPFLCTRAVLPQMIARRRGRIINIASGAGAMASPFYSSYIVSKTALIRMTECLALETAAHGLAMFAISPGTVRTAMSEDTLHSPEGQRWLPWYRRVFEQQIDVPADRPARLVLELASGRLDALSGHFLSVFDDLDLLLRHSAEIAETELYTLRLAKLPGAPGNPALASVLAEARRTAETKK
ncbi:MAG TPA: SDR family oxidoreductase [Terriglobales bacterium]|nr:SDR family oxidoreductase [Terriglobales bacterium]